MSAKKKKIIKWVIIIGAIAAVLTAGGFLLKSCASKPASADANSVQIDTVKRADIVSKIDVSGVIDCRDKEDVYSETPLTVKTIFVKEGDTVKKGQLMVLCDEQERNEMVLDVEKSKLDIDSAKQSIITSEIEYKQDEMNLKQKKYDLEKMKKQPNQDEDIAKNNLLIEQSKKELTDKKDALARDEELYTNGGISKKQLEDSKDEVKKFEDDLHIAIMEQDTRIKDKSQKVDQSTQDYEIAEKQHELKRLAIDSQKASIIIKEKELEIQKNKLNKSQARIVSPCDGKILKIGVETSEKTDSAKPVVEILRISTFVTKVDISQYDSANIKVGQSAIVNVDSLNKKLKGVITKISPTAQTKKVNNGDQVVVEAEVEITEQDPRLRPGYSVDVEIVTQNKKNALTVPILALMKDIDDSEYVYIVNSKNVVEKRIVKSGASDDLNAEVSNVKEGEKVATDVSSNIQEGMTITTSDTGVQGDKK